AFSRCAPTGNLQRLHLSKRLRGEGEPDSSPGGQRAELDEGNIIFVAVRIVAIVQYDPLDLSPSPLTHVVSGARLDFYVTWAHRLRKTVGRGHNPSRRD